MRKHFLGVAILTLASVLVTGCNDGENTAGFNVHVGVRGGFGVFLHEVQMEFFNGLGTHPRVVIPTPALTDRFGSTFVPGGGSRLSLPLRVRVLHGPDGHLGRRGPDEGSPREPRLADHRSRRAVTLRISALGQTGNFASDEGLAVGSPIAYGTYQSTLGTLSTMYIVIGSRAA
jgi:hypothetical protein